MKSTSNLILQSSLSTINTESTMEGSYGTSLANSLELIELFSVNKRILSCFPVPRGRFWPPTSSPSLSADLCRKN
jgi:hypothetical protein